MRGGEEEDIPWRNYANTWSAVSPGDGLITGKGRINPDKTNSKPGQHHTMGYLSVGHHHDRSPFHDRLLISKQDPGQNRRTPASGGGVVAPAFRRRSQSPGRSNGGGGSSRMVHEVPLEVHTWLFSPETLIRKHGVSPSHLGGSMFRFALIRFMQFY